MNARSSFLFLLVVVLLVPPLRAGDTPDLGAIQRLLDADEPSARASALRRLAGRLAGHEGQGATRLLLRGLADPHPYVQRAAAGVLGTAADEARPSIERQLSRLREASAKAAACRVLALWADTRGRHALMGCLGAADAVVRRTAVRWLADDPDESVGQALRSRLQDRDGEVRALALDALVARGAQDLDLERWLGDEDWRVRLSALEGSAVGTPPLQGGGKAVVALLHGLEDAVWSVRFLAAELSRKVPDARLLPPLVRALSDSRPRVSEEAHASLVALTGIPFDPKPEIWAGWLATDGVDFDPAARKEVEPEFGRRRPPERGGRTVARSRFMGLAVASRHVAFVLDGSGSMRRRLEDGRTRWAGACDALDVALAGLGPVDGNVFVFRDEVEAAFQGLERLTSARRRRLASWLQAIRPSGRTALFDGLAAALADPEIDTIVLLSDGAPSAGQFFTKTDLLTEVRRLNRWRRARIDVISLGTDGLAARWKDVLKRLAEESGGTWLKR